MEEREVSINELKDIQAKYIQELTKEQIKLLEEFKEEYQKIAKCKEKQK